MQELKPLPCPRCDSEPESRIVFGGSGAHEYRCPFEYCPMHHDWQAIDDWNSRGETFADVVLERNRLRAENAALRRLVEALEWQEECRSVEDWCDKRTRGKNPDKRHLIAWKESIDGMVAAHLETQRRREEVGR